MQSNVKIFAGIDGGGTRTRLALVRENGELLGYAAGGSCSFTDHGTDHARKELSNLWRTAWEAAGMEPRAASSLFLGLGSILSPEDARINRDLAAKIGLAAPDSIFAENDVWNAHAGGLLGRHGILLISGTGSACFGRNSQNHTWRAGGWGHLLNDVGSAHALGHAAMVAATRDADRRGPATALTPLVCQTFGLTDLKELFRKVHHDGVSRAEVAALAPKVVALAGKGDVTAGLILAAESTGLVEMVTTVARELKLEAPALALTGGLITNAAIYRRMFLERLTRMLPKFQLVEENLTPVFGAVLLACERNSGASPSAAFIQTLHRTSANCLNQQ